jgi:hypothetical protein
MKIILGLLFLTFGISGFAQDSKHGILYMSKSWSPQVISLAEIQTSGGGISVSGVNNVSESRLEIYVSANNSRDNYSKEELTKKIESDYDLNVTVSANKLTAIAKRKNKFNNGNNSLNISFVVYVPVNCGTRLNTSGGGISMENLNGDQQFSTSGGGLQLKGISGHIVGRTSGGGIEVSNSKDDIDLETSGGGIEAKHCSGKIHLGTSGGSLDLTDLDGNIRANTSGGNVEGTNIQGDLETHTSGGNIAMSGLRGSLNASTSGGNLHIQITQLGKFVKLNNSGGNILLEIPKDKGLNLDIHGERIKTEGLNNFSGSVEKERISGTLNGGGIPVDVHGGSGGITLALK